MCVALSLAILLSSFIVQLRLSTFNKVYEDDNASVGSLQKMLDICYVSGTEIGTAFNTKKATLFAVGKAYDVTIEDLKIGHDTISWNDRQ